MNVDGVETVRGRRADDLDAPHRASRHEHHVAGGEDRRLAVERDPDDAGHDGVEAFAILGLRRHDGPGRPGISGYLISDRFDLVANRGFGDGTIASRIPALDPHDGEHRGPHAVRLTCGAASGWAWRAGSTSSRSA